MTIPHCTCIILASGLQPILCMLCMSPENATGSHEGAKQSSPPWSRASVSEARREGWVGSQKRKSPGRGDTGNVLVKQLPFGGAGLDQAQRQQNKLSYRDLWALDSVRLCGTWAFTLQSHCSSTPPSTPPSVQCVWRASPEHNFPPPQS
jgi:hypothetical protein